MPNNILTFPRSVTSAASPRISPRISLSAEETAFPHPRLYLLLGDRARHSITPIDPLQERTIQVRSAIAHVDLEIANYTTCDRLRRLFA